MQNRNNIVIKIDICYNFSVFTKINQSLEVDFMLRKKYYFYKKTLFLVLTLFVVGMFTACEQEQSIDNKTVNDTNKTDNTKTTKNTIETLKTEDMKEKFGENCISEQTFEVELSEYSGKVYFVPFAPSKDNQDFSIQIIQDGKVLTNIHTYIPDELTKEKFSSLDAVSFFDINYDGNTDIVLIETYGDKTFAAIYYGFSSDADDYEKFFISQDELSKKISSQLQEVSIPEIRNLLSNGKKNDKFTSYQEAYEAVSKLCEMESTEEKGYNLIYFNDDDIPELVVGVNGYYTSLYTYSDGKVYTLMDHWTYGAMGNAGYEYCPRKNSLRNYNNDYAGAIFYTTYMTMNNQYSLDTVTQIKTYNFDDVNGNGIPDENETDSIGYYSVSYIGDTQITDEECASYNVGEYQYIQTEMDLETLKAKLNN